MFHNKTAFSRKTLLDNELIFEPVFVIFGVSLRQFSIENSICEKPYQKPTGQQILSFLNVFSIVMYEPCQTFDRHGNKMFNIAIFRIFDHFDVIMGHSGVFGVNQNSPKTCTNPYRTKLNLRHLNIMGESLQLGYKFGT